MKIHIRLYDVTKKGCKKLFVSTIFVCVLRLKKQHLFKLFKKGVGFAFFSSEKKLRMIQAQECMYSPFTDKSPHFLFFFLNLPPFLVSKIHQIEKSNGSCKCIVYYLSIIFFLIILLMIESFNSLKRKETKTTSHIRLKKKINS